MTNQPRPDDAKHEPNPVTRGGRFIYVEHSQRDMLWALQPHDASGTLEGLVAAWDAAPADAAEAVVEAVEPLVPIDIDRIDIKRAVSLALGYPHTEQA